MVHFDRQSRTLTPRAVLMLAAALSGLAHPAQSAEPGKTGYHVTNKYTLGGDAVWDYIAVDPEARRVYITHYQNVEVLDIDTGKVVGRITGMKGARGVAIARSAGKGYATNGKTDSVIVFDPKTWQRIGEIPVGKKPDAIIYDAGTDRILVNNGDGDSMSVIDPKTDTVAGTIPLGGGPEFLAAAAPRRWDSIPKPANSFPLRSKVCPKTPLRNPPRSARWPTNTAPSSSWKSENKSRVYALAGESTVPARGSRQWCGATDEKASVELFAFAAFL